MTEITDTQSLRDLAQTWRDCATRLHCRGSDELLDGDPGPSITARQLEWAAREIDTLRQTLRRISALPHEGGFVKTAACPACIADEALGKDS